MKSVALTAVLGILAIGAASCEESSAKKDGAKKPTPALRGLPGDDLCSGHGP